MKTEIAPKFLNLQHGAEAESILRACVHCGFCNATCPTYQELQDERDGPRGRIYLIKQLLEGGEVTERSRTHLDRCLTCRSCETTCPSGVKYGRLIDIARDVMEIELPRGPGDKFKRWMLRKILPTPVLFSNLVKLGQMVRPLMPEPLRSKIPPRQIASPWPKSSHKRVMLILESCGQPSTTPNTNAAAARVLDGLGISLLVAPEASCCGALSYHLGAHKEGLKFMRRNIDAWWPVVENGAEAIVISASGCGPMVQEYGHLLKDDPDYAAKATRISELTKDLSEIIGAEDLSNLSLDPTRQKIALHIPCTLQHGMGLPDTVGDIFLRAGFRLAKTEEGHSCCGSAGTYSLLEPKLSARLLRRKLKALMVDDPDQIATANIGCQLHLQTKSQKPVQHWIELLDQAVT
jgi:glycolate oxidase iron-sulfur subunit